MKQFGTILKFELKNYFKNKIFVGVTIALVILIAGVMFFPRIQAVLKSVGENTGTEDDTVFESEEANTGTEDGAVMLVAADNASDAEQIRDAFATVFTDYNIQIFEGDRNTMEEEITSGKVECAFVFDSLSSYTYYVDNLSMYDSNTYIADEILQNVYRMNAMMDKGITADEASQILSKEIHHEIERLGKDQMENYWYTYIMIFTLYMVILLYGQMVATNVATEKSSRAMELLITSAKPVAMMFGKVIASCLAGLIQLVCVFGSSLLFFNLNRSYWGENAIINSIFNMPAELLAYMLLFFVLGFFIYAFLFGAVGSTVSKVEDINTAVMPITLLFVIAFLVVMMSMSSGNVDNLLMIVCSYVPFTSPMAMFTRIAMSTVPPYEIAISVAILMASTCGVGVLAAKIYRVGVLLYGTTPKIGTILKSVWKA
jgi:ABC-2 type transport system permease protein